MYNNRAHPLLQQVPLTVSPFVSLPTATTLSYNYKTMPSNIPASGLGIPTASEDPSHQPKPNYVVSNSGHAAHPDGILASCRALQEHLNKMQDDADRELREFEDRIRERELAEKRRLAPGWLDSEARLLEPERAASAQQQGEGSGVAHSDSQKSQEIPVSPIEDPGAAMDRAFGGMELK